GILRVGLPAGEILAVEKLNPAVVALFVFVAGGHRRECRRRQSAQDRRIQPQSSSHGVVLLGVWLRGLPVIVNSLGTEDATLFFRTAVALSAQVCRKRRAYSMKASRDTLRP